MILDASKGIMKKKRVNKMTSDNEIARVKFMLANGCGHSVELYDSQ